MIHNKSYIYPLSILSILALTVSNISTPIWDAFGLTEPNWLIGAAYSIMSAWGLPLLVSTIGVVVFTGENSYSIEHVYKKIFPISVAGCMTWWVVIALIYMKYNFPNELDRDTFLECMSAVLEAPYNAKILHLSVVLWGVYPLIKRIAKDEMLTLYAVVVFFSMSAAFPFLENFKYVRYITLFTNQINWNFFTSYGGYLFLGIWLSRKNFQWHNRILVYCLGLLSTVAIYACTAFWSSETIGFDHRFVSENSLLVLFQVIAVFVLIKRFSKNGRSSTAIMQYVSILFAAVPGYAIGSSLVNYILILDTVPIAFSIPVESGVCFIVSGIIAIGIARISFLSRSYC